MHKSLYLSAAIPFFVELLTAQGLRGLPGNASKRPHVRGLLSFQSFELKWVFYEHLRYKGQE